MHFVKKTALISVGLIVIIGAIFVSNSYWFVAEDSKAGKVYKSGVSDPEKAFSLVEMSFALSASEICHAGLFRDYYAIDVKEMIPDLEGYQTGVNTVFWSWNFIPTSFQRIGYSLIVYGKRTEDNKVYFTLLPKRMTVRISQINVDSENATN